MLSLYHGILATPQSVPPHIPRLRAWLFPVGQESLGALVLPGSGREILLAGAGRGQGWDGSRLSFSQGPSICSPAWSEAVWFRQILVLGSSHPRLPGGRVTRETRHAPWQRITLQYSHTYRFPLLIASIWRKRSHSLHGQKGNKQSSGGRVPPLLQPDGI